MLSSDTLAKNAMPKSPMSRQTSVGKDMSGDRFAWTLALAAISPRLPDR